jgi:hypothetical protein
MPMTSPILANWATRYGKFYLNYGLDWWNNMGPMQYGTVLILVALFGWILMKSRR